MPTPKKTRSPTLKRKSMKPDSQVFDWPLANQKTFDYASGLSVADLEQLLSQAADAYYNTDHPLLSDDAFDTALEVLRTRAPKSKFLKQVRAPLPAPAAGQQQPKKVKLPYHLGSMTKIKPGERALTLWLEKYSGPYSISEKLDGLTSLLILKVIKNSATGEKELEQHFYKHGDENESEEISHMLGFMRAAPKDSASQQKLIKLIEKINPGKNLIAVRGEIIITKAKFQAKYAKEYPKARSLIAGMTNCLPEKYNQQDTRNKARDLDFVSYTVLDPPGLLQSKQFEFLADCGFLVARNSIEPVLDEEKLKELMLEYKSASEYEIDGIIVTDNQTGYKYPTSGDPKYAVAFKMRLEEQMAITTVEYVEYNITKNGLLKPRVKFAPVIIGGDSINYATGFNAKFIKEHNIGQGAEIHVIKSGDVIPYILAVTKPAARWQEPAIPYEWVEGGIDIRPRDLADAPEMLNKVLLHFFDTLDVDGLKSGTIDKLIAAGFNSVNLILSLRPESLLKIPGFQVKSAQKLVDNIRTGVLDKQHRLSVIMTASNIWPGFGVKRFELITAVIPQERLVSAPSQTKSKPGSEVTLGELVAIDGLSDKTAQAFLDGLPKFRIWLADHPLIHIAPPHEATTPVPVTPPRGLLAELQGQKLVFTGFRDAELEERLAKYGITLQSGVSKSTRMVIAADPNESSSKLTKARELGIEIMSADDFRKKV